MIHLTFHVRPADINEGAIHTPQSLGIARGCPSPSHITLLVRRRTTCSTSTLRRQRRTDSSTFHIQLLCHPHYQSNFRQYLLLERRPRSLELWRLEWRRVGIVRRAKPRGFARMLPKMHYVTSYSAVELRTFRCERVRKMLLSGLDPSVLIGFLRKEADRINLRRGVAEVRSLHVVNRHTNCRT